MGALTTFYEVIRNYAKEMFMPGKELVVGDDAPDFLLPCWPEGELRLSELRGRYVVLYFYPRDNTPGCTLESTDFRDAGSAFERAGATILGISRDSINSHQKFAEKFNLPFPLLSDVNEEACRAFAVMKMKNMYGRQVRGIERSTFLIDGQGRVVAIWRRVRVKGHVAAVLDRLAELNTGNP